MLAFVAHPLTAVLVLMATFFHPVTGLMGLTGNIIANATARWIGGSRDVWQAGVYGVSGLLVGIALGMYTEPTLRIWLFLVFGAAISGMLSVLAGAKFAKNDLPILSLPFLFVIWPLLLVVGTVKPAFKNLSNINLIYRIDAWLFDNLPLALFEFVKMFGNILFQENLISGVLVLLAIALYSRISLLYSLYGGILGMVTYTFLHGSLDGFHGLNYILTALAFGGFFVISSPQGWLLATFAIVSAGVLDYATAKVLSPVVTGNGEGLPSLVFAFNIITLAFLYPLKISWNSKRQQRLIPVPLSVVKSPESNLRWLKRWFGRQYFQKTNLSFPFMGDWSVLQGNDGEWTHKDSGRYAWDFIIRDDRGKQHRGLGTVLKDYYAFGLPVLAPAPGTIYDILNSVEDNPPGSAVTERNWGNYVIIDHGNGEFTELSHFRQGTIAVVPGQHVKRGQLLGYCGNSGRSAVPHIHLQLQAAAQPGAASLPALFSEGVVNGAINVNINPAKDDLVRQLDIDSENSWNLIGREGESWIFQCRMGLLNFKEKLEFTTDAFGYPIIRSKNYFTWHIIDKLNFVEIRPDFKTFPTILSPSGWMKVVGESLIIPRKLKHDFAWNGGRVELLDSGEWLIETRGKLLTIDQNFGVINKCKLRSDPAFIFELKSHSAPV